MPVTEKRVSSLERTLENFITSVKESHMRTESELREFKDEMLNYKEENRQQIREMNIKWGEGRFKLLMQQFTKDLMWC